MARAHDIPIASDTREFDEGIRSGVIKPLENAEKAFRDLEREAENAGDGASDAVEDLGKKLDDVGEAAQDAGSDSERGLDKLEEALKDAQRETKKTEDALDDVGTGGRKSFEKAGEGARELQNEVGANMGEAMSSFRGDMEDIGQIGQDTLGGLAATAAQLGGPAGLIAGIGLGGAAALFGTITQSIMDQNEEAEKLRERLSSAYEAAAEAGRDYLDTSQFIGEANDLMFNPDRAEEYSRLLEEHKTLGIDMNTMFKASAGDLDSIELIQQRITDETRKQYENASLLGPDPAKTLFLEKMAEKWGTAGDEATRYQSLAAESIETTNAMLMDAYRNAETATEQVDEFGNKLISLPDGTEFVIDAKTQKATDDVSKFEGDADGVIDNLNRKDIQLRVNVDDSAARNWRPPTFATTLQVQAATAVGLNAARKALLG